MWLAVLSDCVTAGGWLGTNGDIAAAISISQLRRMEMNTFTLVSDTVSVVSGHLQRK